MNQNDENIERWLQQELSNEKDMRNEDYSDKESDFTEDIVQVEDCESNSEFEVNETTKNSSFQAESSGKVCSRSRSLSRTPHENNISDDDILSSPLKSASTPRKKNYFAANSFRWASISILNVSRARTPQHKFI
ncbi:unnamed protein product, partial [Brenthis ino]